MITKKILDEDLSALEIYLNIDAMFNLISGREREINQPDDLIKDTPLVFAIIKLASTEFKSKDTMIKIIQKLLEFGADPDLESYSGLSMDIATDSGLTEVIKILKEPVEPIFDKNLSREENIMAFTADHSQIFKSIPDYAALKIALNLDKINVINGGKSEVNNANKFGQPPMQYAIFAHKDDPKTLKKIVKLFLDHGADPLQEDSLGRSALNTARTIENGQEIVDLIEKHIKTETNESTYEDAINNEYLEDLEFDTTEESDFLYMS